jgi:hypothetical protein
MPISYNLKVGTPDTTPDAPSHTPGVRQGNSPPVMDPGFKKTPTGMRATARRSTGVSPESRNPITPDAPNLPPA